MSNSIIPVGSAVGGFTPSTPQLSPGAPVQPTGLGDLGGKTVTQPAPIPTSAINPGGHAAASPVAIQSALAHVQDYLKNLSAEVQYSMDKATGDTVFKVVNSVTGAVIRQVPSEDILVMAGKLKALDEKSTGLLLDQQT